MSEQERKQDIVEIADYKDFRAWLRSPKYREVVKQENYNRSLTERKIPS